MDPSDKKTKSYMREFGLLLAFPVEVLALVVGAIYLGEWLNEKYPRPRGWGEITLVIAFVGIIYRGYILIKLIAKGKAK